MVSLYTKVYPFITPQKEGTFTMMKKLISMLLPNEPDEPDNPITVMCMTPGYTGSGEQPVD